MLENISDNVLKRLRLRFINGINNDGELIYEGSFDLTRKDEIKKLIFLMNGGLDILGFSVEMSSFDNNEYDYSKLGENEFHPLIEYFIGKQIGNDVVIFNELFHKPEYWKVVRGERDIKQELMKILATSLNSNSLENIVNSYGTQKNKVYSYKRK